MSHRTVSSLIVIALALGGCQAMKKMTGKEKDIKVDEMSQPARATLDKEIGSDGKIEKVTREEERGRTVYDVEANVGGQHKEYLIADNNGELLGTEVPIDFAQVPQPVQDAAQKHFGTTTGLTAMKGVEYGETHYEIEGMKNGKKSEASFNPDGSPEK
jgi:uncharacterized membrane protein YkoI